MAVPQPSQRPWDYTVRFFGSSTLKVVSAFPQSFLPFSPFPQLGVTSGPWALLIWTAGFRFLSSRAHQRPLCSPPSTSACFVSLPAQRPVPTAAHPGFPTRLARPSPNWIRLPYSAFHLLVPLTGLVSCNSVTPLSHLCLLSLCDLSSGSSPHLECHSSTLVSLNLSLKACPLSFLQSSGTPSLAFYSLIS